MQRLWLSRLKSIGAVPDGDNPEARILLWKARDFTPEQREAYAESGVAMPDGSYPIPDKDALRRAIQAYGRASNPAAVRAHIIRRARALNAGDMLPDDWQQKGVAVDVDEIEKVTDELEEGVEEEPEAPVVAEAEDEIAKRIGEAEAEIVKAREERDAALAQLQEEVAKRRAADFISKARQYEELLGPAEEVAPSLDRLEAAAPEAYLELEKRLQAALERVNLTKEIGVAGDDGADPIRKRDAWVRKYVLDHPDVSAEKARALFWKANPEALEAQREDQK